MRRGHRLLSLALAALVPACSWAFVDPPPLYVGAEAAEVVCTDGLASPIADTVIAAGMYAAGAALAAGGCRCASIRR